MAYPLKSTRQMDCSAIFLPLCSRLIQQNVKRDDAHFIEQDLGAP